MNILNKNEEMLKKTSTDTKYCSGISSLKIIKIKKLKGDFQVEEFDENKLFINQDKQKKLINTTNNGRKSSSLYKDISKENFKLVRERNLTPTQRKTNEKIVNDINRKETNNSNKSKKRKSKFSLKKDNYILSPNHNTKSSNSNGFNINTYLNSNISLSSDFKRDEDLFILCSLINESKQEGWKEVYTQENISIYKKTNKFSPSIMIKTYGLIDGYTKDEVYEAISNVTIRRKWDKIFSEFKILESNEKEEKEVLYMSIKSPNVFVADRDFVQQRKIWKNFPDDSSTIIHFKSVNHALAPEKPKIVRAQTIISGYFIKTICKSPPKTFISIVSQTDIKGNIPKFLVNSISQKAPKEWILNLTNGCEIVRKIISKV